VEQAASHPRVDASQRFQHWAFDSLPELMEIEHDGQQLIGFPALVDHGKAVGLQVFDDLDAAHVAHEDGLMRLLTIHFASRCASQSNYPMVSVLRCSTANGEMRKNFIKTCVMRSCSAPV
jgi:hypothetical protein